MSDASRQSSGDLVSRQDQDNDGQDWDQDNNPQDQDNENTAQNKTSFCDSPSLLKINELETVYKLVQRQIKLNTCSDTNNCNCKL